MLIDTHCHLSEEYYDNIDEVILDNRKAGVFRIIISGCDRKGIEEALIYTKMYDDAYMTAGFHPEEVDRVSDADLEYLKKVLQEKKTVGLGEIGLDYHYVKDNRAKQIALFEKQLQIAESMNLPVVIHSRDAVKDTIDSLRKFKVKGIIHCFSGSYETAKTYVDMGYKLGIGGVITFKNSKLGEVVKKIGIENIVLETDSPYLAPEPFRGKKNSSKYLKEIVKKIASVTELSYDDVSRKTTSNSQDMFDLD